MTPDIKRYRLRHRARPLDVLVAGDGTPLLLLHGWGLSGRPYRSAMLALADRGYRVLAPGTAVGESWSVARAAELAAEAMAGLDAAPAAIVGHSFGGVVGVQVAMDHRDFVQALVPVNAPLVPMPRHRIGRIILPGSHYRIAVHGGAAAAFLRSVSSREGARSLMTSVRWFFSDGHAAALADLGRSGLPIEMVWAERDALLPLAYGEQAARIFGCELLVVREGNGWPGRRPPDHDWPFREPAHFAATIDQVVKGLTA